MKNNFDVFFDKDNNLYQVRTKNNTTLIEFTDMEKENIFKEILFLYSHQNKYSLVSIQKKLKHVDSFKLLDVVKELQSCSILNKENFETEVPDIQEYPVYTSQRELRLVKDITLSYLGDEELGQIIKNIALKSKYENVHNYSLRNLGEDEILSIIDKSDFVIVDSLEWNPVKMGIINSYALKTNKPWLIVEGINHSGKFSMGPIFHGKYTGCYHCYKSRLNSNDEFLIYTKSYEQYLKENNLSAKPDEDVSTSLKNIAASIIILDITKYIEGWYPPEMWKGTLLLNLHNYQVERHEFLKAPLCSECKPKLDYNQAPWFESVTLKS